jgi:hypothetical protein
MVEEMRDVEECCVWQWWRRCEYIKANEDEDEEASYRVINFRGWPPAGDTSRD